MLENKDWFIGPSEMHRANRPFTMEDSETIRESALRYGYVSLDEIDGYQLFSIDRGEMHWPYLIISQWGKRQTLMFYSHPALALDMWSKLKTTKLLEKIVDAKPSKSSKA